MSGAVTISDVPDTDLVPGEGTHLRLSGAELTWLADLRAALGRYREHGDTGELDRAFVAARALIGALPGGGGGAPEIARLRWLADELDEFGELLTAAADEAGEAVAGACAELWTRLGLRSAPPRWTPDEHEAARMVFACACVREEPVGGGSVAHDWVGASLRRVSARRLAELLVAELCRGEAVWLRALDGGYGSLRHRCAPRTPFRSRGLSDLLRSDEDCRAAVAARLERWVAAGCDRAQLPAELEAAVVHVRTPSRLA